VPGPHSYVLCGTPRTGSTLLCSLLTSTGVAGRPESYFREPDHRTWAGRFGVSVQGGGEPSYPEFVAGAIRFGSTPNGVFAARVMWGTMSRIVSGLGPTRDQRDVDVLEEAFGALRFVHLQRRDVVGQAVSWARAEQTAYWQHGDVVRAEPRLDLDQMDELVATIQTHHAAGAAGGRDQRRLGSAVPRRTRAASQPVTTGRFTPRWRGRVGDQGRRRYDVSAPHAAGAPPRRARWSRRPPR
jgi:trehalose 2-sulfotransferase